MDPHARYYGLSDRLIPCCLSLSPDRVKIIGAAFLCIQSSRNRSFWGTGSGKKEVGGRLIFQVGQIFYRMSKDVSEVHIVIVPEHSGGEIPLVVTVDELDNQRVREAPSALDLCLSSCPKIAKGVSVSNGLLS